MCDVGSEGQMREWPKTKHFHIPLKAQGIILRKTRYIYMGVCGGGYRICSEQKEDVAAVNSQQLGV